MKECLRTPQPERKSVGRLGAERTGVRLPSPPPPASYISGPCRRPRTVHDRANDSSFDVHGLQMRDRYTAMTIGLCATTRPLHRGDTHSLRLALLTRDGMACSYERLDWNEKHAIGTERPIDLEGVRRRNK